MNNLLNTIKSKIPELLNKLRVGLENMPKTVKYVLIGYILIVAIVLLLYLGCWIYLFVLDKVMLSELLAYLRILIDGSMVGFVTFILGMLVDTNNNGTPDVLEEGEDKK